MSPTLIIYVAGLITSMILVVILIFTIYRFSQTTVTAVIENINCSANDCKLNIVYYYNSIKVNSVLTSKFKEWRVNQTIPVYINPKDLSNPRYAPAYTSIILYVTAAILLLFMILSIYKLFIIYQDRQSSSEYVPVRMPVREYVKPEEA